MPLPKLPQELVVDSLVYPINTDFRHWIDIQSLFNNPKLTQPERLNIALRNAYGCIPPAYDAALNSLLDFLACGETFASDPPDEPLLDIERDFQAIWGDFRVYARIDLRTIPYLHWWEFNAILLSLPNDSQIKYRIKTRGIKLSEIDDPKMRESYRKQKEAVSLVPVEDNDPFYAGL